MFIVESSMAWFWLLRCDTCIIQWMINHLEMIWLGQNLANLWIARPVHSWLLVAQSSTFLGSTGGKSEIVAGWIQDDFSNCSLHRSRLCFHDWQTCDSRVSLRGEGKNARVGQREMKEGRDSGCSYRVIQWMAKSNHPVHPVLPLSQATPFTDSCSLGFLLYEPNI